MNRYYSKIKTVNGEKRWKGNGEVDQQCMDCEVRQKRWVSIKTCKRLFDCPFGKK